MSNELALMAGKINEHEQTLRELFKLIKFHNAASLLSVNTQDMKDLALTLQKEYPIHIVKAALHDVKTLHANKDLTIGRFLEKCFALKRAEDSYVVADTPKERSKAFGLEYLSKVKQYLFEINKTLKKHRIELAHDASGPILYFKCIETDLVLRFEEVQGKDLQELYKRAWDVGLSLEEKAHMNQLMQ